MATPDAQIAALQAQLAASQTQAAASQAQLAASQTQAAASQAQLAASQAQAAASQAQLAASQTQAAASQAQAAALQAQLTLAAASPPPYAALQHIFTHLSTVSLCGVMRTSREWSTLVRSGGEGGSSYFRVISIALELCPAMEMWNAPGLMSATQRCGKSSGQFNDINLQRLLMMAGQNLVCLHLSGLQRITAGGCTTLLHKHALRALVICDCSNIDAVRLAAHLPSTLRALRLDGACGRLERRPTGADAASEPYSLFQLLDALGQHSHEWVKYSEVNLSECDRCQQVCLRDEPLVCEECTREFCSNGCIELAQSEEHANLCTVCDKCYCEQCQRTTPCVECRDEVCAECVDAVGASCDACWEWCCEPCQARRNMAKNAWLVSCGSCNVSRCIYCQNGDDAFDTCEKCGEVRCSDCSTCPAWECETCAASAGVWRQLCKGCAPAEGMVACVVCGNICCDGDACGLSCSRCLERRCRACAAVESGEDSQSERCQACANHYCAECSSGCVDTCDVCAVAFACDTPACMAQLARRSGAGVCESCGVQTCEACDCECPLPFVAAAV